jgi:hypothetical protein
MSVPARTAWRAEIFGCAAAEATCSKKQEPMSVGSCFFYQTISVKGEKRRIVLRYVGHTGGVESYQTFL